ncbi:hypothetical protein ACFW9L_16110 [Streptomyces sp. NPDC059517]|uniref:hypothetical protein n=1 Tax=Streptomyces sp. NPDC059517 TaxID=3346855 RepID=UPI0036A6F8C6
MARNITEDTQLSQADLAEARTNSHLGQPVDLPTLPVRLLWARIRLTAAPQQAAHVDQLLREQHQTEHDARQDRRRLQRAKDLRDALLADPSLAFAYWFLDHPEAADEATVQHLERLITTAASYAPDNTWVHVARILQDFVSTLPGDARQHLITSLAHILDRYGQPERAHELRTAGHAAPLSPPAAQPGVPTHT